MADLATRAHHALAQIGGLSGYLALFLALAACTASPPQELVDISPDLALENTSSAARAEDLSGAADVAPIVIASLQNQSTILGAAERVRSQFAKIEEERSGFYPQISAGIGSSLVGNDDAAPQLRLTGSQLLYDFGRTGRRVSREVLLAQKAHLEFLDVVDGDLSDLLRLLVKYDSQSEQIDLARTRLVRMEELAALVEKRTVEGAGTVDGPLEAERRVQTAKTVLLRTELELAGSRRAITDETGVAIDENSLDLNLDRLDCSAASFDAGQISGIRMAQIDMALAQLDLQTAESARRPTFAVEAATSHGFSDLWNTDGVGVNLRVDTTVFKGGAVRSQKAAAARNEAAALAAFEGERQEARRRFREARDSVVSKEVMADALRDQSDLTDKTRVLYRQQFVELGTRTLDDVFDAEEEYHQNLLDVQLALQDAALEQVSCLAAQGLLRRFVGIENTLLHGLALVP